MRKRPGLLFCEDGLDRAEARKKFCRQRWGAKQRGIEWRLTFEQWMAWWGEDLDKRGREHDCLQMQRFHDKGAYELGNIKKGFPRENAKTKGNCCRNKAAVSAGVRLEQRRDKGDIVDKQNPLEEFTDDERYLNKMFGVRIYRNIYW